jgi:hypothetical protein
MMLRNIQQEVEQTRKPRATLIQSYSRETAKPATEKGKTKINL